MKPTTFVSISLALLLALGGCAKVEEAAPGTPLGVTARGLLELEAAIVWSAVTPDWKARRPGWQKAVQAATTPAELAEQLLALETAMGWPAVVDEWRTMRPKWIAELKQVETAGDVAKLVVILETATKWEVVAPSWQKARPGWLAKLQAVR